jgi:hypothetical protein
MASPYKHWLKL